MALDPRTTQAPHGAAPETKADLTAFVDHVRDNPVLYVAAVAFLIVCVIVGVAYRAYRAEAEQAGATAYARALDTEVPAARVDALAEFSAGPDWLEAESLYMAGEAAFDVGDLDKAKTLFEQLRAEHPDYEFTPDAVEAMGFIAEENGDHAAAIAHYEEIGQVWPDAFAARRQPMNIGRANEATENYEAAVAAYREQLDIFPGSNVATRAQQALDRLRETHPALFPEEAVATDPVDTGISSPLDIDLNLEPEPAPMVQGETSESGAPEEAAPETTETEATSPEGDATATAPDEAAVEVPNVDAAVSTEAPETAETEEEPAAPPAAEADPEQPQS